MTTPQRSIRSGFGAKSTADDVLDGLDLGGRLAVLTGGYSGQGLEATRALTRAGAQVVDPARRREAAEEALAGVEGDELDLATSRASPRSRTASSPPDAASTS